jgi:ribosome assembly protein 1
MQSAVAAAFESVTANAPLMGEALQGVAVVVQRVEVCREQAMVLSQLAYSEKRHGAADGGSGSTDGGGVPGRRRLHAGQFISEVSCGLRGALLTAGLRVVEPVYACGLQCDAARLGDLYSVLSRRRGQVVNEDIVEGTSLFVMTSYLPVLESFGFAQELLKKTSGAGTTPQLSFSHWSPISEDPFWVPTTDAERDEFGEVGAFNALAKEASWSRALVMRVRRRKGLVLEEKVVASAEKQRTLKR